MFREETFAFDHREGILRSTVHGDGGGSATCSLWRTCTSNSNFDVQRKNMNTLSFQCLATVTVTVETHGPPPKPKHLFVSGRSRGRALRHLFSVSANSLSLRLHSRLLNVHYK